MKIELDRKCKLKERKHVKAQLYKLLGTQHIRKRSTSLTK
jgi:hypothetical protein